MKQLLFFFCIFSKIYGNSLEEQQEFFHKNGYVWIKNFFSPEQVLLLRNWADTIDMSAQTLLALSSETGYSLQALAQKISGTLIVVPEAQNSMKVCRAEDMLTCYPEFHQFMSGTLTAYLSMLMGEPYTLFKDKINFKWPGGGAFPPHQDFPAYEWFGPREHITAMVCIDPATLENGCLQVAKNWKETFPDISVLPYITGGKNHGSIETEYSEKISWLPLEAAAGDVVFFSSYLPHYSEPNQSNTARRALFITHNRLKEGNHREAYYNTKRADPDNPVFHFATPTKARTK